MSDALSAIGTLLKKGDGQVVEVFATIAEVKDITGPELSLDVQDVTSQDSEDGWEEVVPTILKSGKVTFDLNFIPTDETQDAHTGLISDMVGKVKRNFKLIFPDAAATTWSFAAYVVEFKPTAPVSGILTASVGLKITGKPTLAPGS